ncbi:MAG: Rz1-like lysis system protein LysC [Pseudomonadota bacterium]
MNNLKHGLASLFLIALSGCASGPQSAEPSPTVITCATPSPCQLSPSSPKTAGDLNVTLEQTEADWLRCAMKVDDIIQCHEKHAQEQVSDE